MRSAAKRRPIKQKALSGRIGLFRFRRAELFGSRDDGNGAALLFTLDGELDHAVLECEEGVVLAAANVFARVEFGAALANDDVASQNELTAVALDAQSLGL